jgi:hypothetical protein
MKSKPRTTKRLRAISHVAATVVVLASAVGFLSALPTPAQADGCSYTAGISCVVDVDISSDEDPIWTGDWNGDWIDEDENNGGGDDPGDGENPGGGTTPNPTVPATTTTTISVTTTTLSPSQKLQRQRQLMRLRLGQADCVNLLLPSPSFLSAIDSLAFRLAYIWAGGEKAVYLAARAGVGDPAGTLMDRVDVQIATSPGQTQVTGAVGPTGTVLTVPQSFFSWGADQGLSGEEVRNAYLLAALARPGTNLDQILLNCFGVVLPGGGD